MYVRVCVSPIQPADTQTGDGWKGNLLFQITAAFKDEKGFLLTLCGGGGEGEGEGRSSRWESRRNARSS